ncbi:ankyrin repeat domain-containing protein [Novipirellula artificiosorum]|uniref:Ankyrin repeats (3 copies) n=1 Tax=Novipirellula artificiosorum TaxID=2528016 RepID=A0A5C6DXQ0_9BACT|nr:ankyrin repeat domain-containing protein [Novipirellula artificiosorum]TWU41014.1 Ankyrin repeats (3 copies) [Novipirellula artificiosorum]
MNLAIHLRLLATTFAICVSVVRAEDSSPIADAAQSQQWQRVSDLISQGHSPSDPQPDGMTAIHWSVFHQNVTTTRQLIEAGANVNATTRYDITPLSIACSAGNAKLVGTLLEASADANATQTGGVTPLMLASKCDNPVSIKLLRSHGAELEATERRGQTAIMWAAAHGNFAAVDALLTEGADPAATSKGGFTALMFAARDGHPKIVDRLIEAGVDVNAALPATKSGERAPRAGTSALILAVESGHFELAMQLIGYGADPNDQRSGFTPLHVLTWVRKPNRGDNPDGDPPPRGSGNITDLQFVRALVDAGADVNRKLESGKGGRAVLNPRGATPMLWAAKTADLPLMHVLFELGADPILGNVEGCTPLMAAAGVGVRAVGEEAGTEREVLQALEFLISCGADVNTVDANQETAMHGAAYRNFPAVVTYLAAHGADPDTWNHKNQSGWTPVMIAQGHRPGSFKPSPETVTALELALKTSP